MVVAAPTQHDPVVASFPLSRGRHGNWAYLTFTRPLTVAEWDLFASILNVMKDGIVEERDEETEPMVELRYWPMVPSVKSDSHVTLASSGSSS